MLYHPPRVCDILWKHAVISSLCVISMYKMSLKGFSLPPLRGLCMVESIPGVYTPVYNLSPLRGYRGKLFAISESKVKLT